MNLLAHVPYVQQSGLARLVLGASVGAFLVGECWQALRVRRDATPTNRVAEVLFRVLFFAAVLFIPAGRALAPGAVIRGGV